MSQNPIIAPSPQALIGWFGLVATATAMNFGIRWLATGASVGPIAIPIWFIAALLFLGPLSIATLELSSRFPKEGAVYAWTGATQGPLAGFVCGFIYWICNLPFFSGLLLFIVPLSAEIAPVNIAMWLTTSWGALITTILILGLILWLNERGIKHSQILAAAGAIISVGLLILLCAAAFIAIGKEPERLSQVFSASSFLALGNTKVTDLMILWSTMVFAFGGAEGVALMTSQTKGGVKTVTKALIGVGIFLCLGYMLGSLSLMILLGPSEATRLSGLSDALSLVLGQFGLEAFKPVLFVLLILALLGQLSSWFAAAARLPFAAGLDKFLPRSLGSLDPKTLAPKSALRLQAVCVILILLLSQASNASSAGFSLAKIYDFINAMSILSYTLPFIFLFVAYILVQSKPMPTQMNQGFMTPGGPKVAWVIGMIGLMVSFSAIMGSVLPPTPQDGLAYSFKIIGSAALLIAIAIGIYWLRTPKTRPNK
jgi:glutamate:GABA antiporter